MCFYRASQQDCDHFRREGFVLVRSLFKKEEAELLSRYARADREVSDRATSRSDAQGGTTTLSLSNDLGDDLYAAVVACPRVANSMGAFLGEEVYHYHHKMMLKEPLVGGAWEWHQDYGYWYDYGCLFPAMGSCFIAIDQATRENGCLQVVPRSHELGRMNHMKVGGQTGADPERIAAILERMEVQQVEMQPGDALFFHGNLLHRSDQNKSPNPRWSLICCYNTKSNSPYKDSRHPSYSKLEMIKDEEFTTIARERLAELPAG
ncbi:MAG: phytanoyl-CoA dioxygenase family protein [Pirellulaceae bacterium]